MYVGIDVGGMSIKAGIVNEDGEILAKASVESPVHSGDAMVRGMYDAMLQALERASVSKDSVTAVGIGSSGICDNERGEILYSGNIAYDHTPVREFFRKHMDARIDVENDANCAAIGEYFAASRNDNCRSFIFVVIGTGVGGGIIINNKLFTGFNGAAGEVGHILLEKDGRPCGCGRLGCWEAYASVSALIRDAKEKGGYFDTLSTIDGKAPFEAAAKGCPEAVEVRDKWIEKVAAGVCDLINIFQPDRLVIGGGISREGETLLAPIRKYVSENVYTYAIPGLKQTEISAAALGNDAGIVGAAFLHKLI